MAAAFGWGNDPTSSCGDTGERGRGSKGGGEGRRKVVHGMAGISEEVQRLLPVGNFPSLWNRGDDAAESRLGPCMNHNYRTNQGAGRRLFRADVGGWGDDFCSTLSREREREIKRDRKEITTRRFVGWRLSLLWAPVGWCQIVESHEGIKFGA